MRTNFLPVRVVVILAAVFMICPSLFAAKNQAPDWMHSLVNVPLPAHDEKDDAVLLYRDENLTVVSTDKFRTTVREVYKILRPEGRGYGSLKIYFNSLNEKVTSIHAWCIPASGKDYEVTDKDAIEQSPLKGEVIMTDERRKVLEIPAPDPGNIIGYEYAMDMHPLVFQDVWEAQNTIPVRESHYSFTLPAGWEFKDAWINSPEVKGHDAGGGMWQWTVADVKEIREEKDMPPWQALAGKMVVTFFPPGGGTAKSLPTWRDVGEWYLGLTSDRVAPSVEIRDEVKVLTASTQTPLAKMQAIAAFMQHDIRYVAISLGIGGWQPHPAAQVFANRYGDCKDKTTLMRSMLKEIGVDSYDVRINVERGSVSPETPAHVGAFNHSIIAIKLPEGLTDPSLTATMKHPKLGTLLFFDPTIGKIPFGQIGGYLQSNYGLLIAPTGGELLELPRQPADMNGIQRTAKLTLTLSGDLRGDVEEVRLGERASDSRQLYTSTEKAPNKIKPVERLLSSSLSMFKINNASVTNADQTDKPFIWNYSFLAENYAKYAGNMLLVRPRVVGSKSSGVLETSEPRRYPIEFEGPVLDTDNFEINFPPNYVVDDVPPAVDADFGFASYHSKTEVAGNVLKYHRAFEVKQLSVPVSQADQLKKFYRIIASDERNTAVLKLVTP